ncbi:metal-dependent hydrolase [Altererythrobacter aerius]|uniref:Metal-dependent hydrolase n=1 Tax=Tsuneonella aeria TaxID=1837929 RepID=A0A6I4TAG8_9SPHN|nr:metal-dependent hydrolase [Tsuneonella aeria]MXO73754.1 metal-dependent hydrolase [Tsuneonella aeria]
MDNLTHSLVGALMGQAGLKRRTGLAMPALIIGANIPDIDAACFLWLQGVQHLAFRRGITHGPIAWVLLPLLLAGGLWWFDRWQARRGKRPAGRLPVRFGWLYALSLIGTLSHPLFDWFNSYGIRLLEPFSSRWFYGDILFIIDPWLLLMLGAGVWASLRREKRGGAWRHPAWLAMVAITLYICMNWAITRDAARLASLDMDITHTIANPAMLDPRKRDLIWVGREGRHVAIPGFAGPTEDRLVTQPMGDAWLPSCDLAEAARRDSQVAAFLFWSRVPFVARDGDGSLFLRDARFADPRAVSRFQVELPPGTCTQFFGQ